jgi:hypothetical protein
MSKTSAIDLVMERVNKFVTCGCCDDDWPPLRRDIADTITRLQAALQFYATQMCEFGKDNEGCGKYDSDVCAGCIAVAALRSSVGGE